MKRVALLIGLLALVVSGCKNNKAAGVEIDYEEAAFKTENFKFEQEGQHYSCYLSCDYPTEGSKMLRDAYVAQLLAFLHEGTDTAGDDFEDGQSLVDYYGEAIVYGLEEQWQAYADGDDSLDDTLNDYIDVNVGAENRNYVTILLHRDMYYGGDGFTQDKGATIIKKTGQLLKNDYLIKDLSNPEFLELYREAYKTTAAQVDGAQAEDVDPGSVEPQSDFFITDKGIAFDFNCSWRQVTATIPIEKVKKHLTPEGLELISQ